MLGETGLSAASSHGVEQRRPCQADDNRVAKKTITILGGESGSASAGNTGGSERQLLASCNSESVGWLHRRHLDSNKPHQRALGTKLPYRRLDWQRNDHLGWMERPRFEYW